MSVIPAEGTYQSKASRLSKTHALTELHRLGALPLPEQEKESRIEIRIGGVITRWTRPVARDAIPHRSIRTGPLPRLAIYDHQTESVALYERTAPREWKRLLFTSEPAEMLAALPKRITDDWAPDRTATPSQLAAIRKLLEIPPATDLPPLHFAAASRIMERVLIEGTVTTLRLDLNRMRAPLPQEAPAGLTK